MNYKTINEQISNFAQAYPTNFNASSMDVLLFMRRYRVDERHDQPIPLDPLTGSDLVSVQSKFTFALPEESFDRPPLRVGFQDLLRG